MRTSERESEAADNQRLPNRPHDRSTKRATARGRFHGVELMDLDWVPRSLRDTQREILELANGQPFRGYYDWIVATVRQSLAEAPARYVVELGAGTAPVTRRLLGADLPDHVRFVVTEIEPDVRAYRALRRADPDRVRPETKPVDFSLPQDWLADSILVLSTAFHHVHPNQRRKVLANLIHSGSRVMSVAA